MRDKQLNDNSQGQLNVIYFTDPLCCWSWIFEPVWHQLRKELSTIMNYKYCMGGMIPSWQGYHDPLNAVSKPIQMGPIWLHAKHVSGKHIDDKLWFRDPPASSYPACVAVKCAALQSRSAEEAYLYYLRQAALVEGKNIAKKEVLLQVANSLADNSPFDYNKFVLQLAEDDAVDDFREDLMLVQRYGITRFPSLMITIDGKKGSLILTGNRPYNAIIDVIQEVLEKTA